MDVSKVDEQFEQLIHSIDLRYGNEPNHQLEFTKEDVEELKSVCLTFKKNFKEYLTVSWNEKPKSNDLKDLVYTWLRNLGSIIPTLLIHPELVEKVNAIPNLDPLVKIVKRFQTNVVFKPTAHEK